MLNLIVHFRAAWIDKCRPDVLITESTYATTVRDSKRWKVFLLQSFSSRLFQKINDRTHSEETSSFKLKILVITARDKI